MWARNEEGVKFLFGTVYCMWIIHKDWIQNITPERRAQRAAVKNVRLGEADGLKNFHPQKWVPNAMK